MCAAVFGGLLIASGAGSGAVTVRSEPTEASVFVDGGFRGVTPVEIGGLTPGRHSVRIEKAGFKALFGVLEAPPRGRGAAFRLEPVDVGTLEVRSEPAGAEAYLDGGFRGITPLTLDGVRAGLHVVRAEKTGHDPATASALVSAGEREVVHLDLEDRVLRYLEYAAGEDPNNMLTHMELGHYYMVIGDPERSAPAYFRATILSRRLGTSTVDRRKLELTVKRDRGRGGQLGARLGAELDRLLVKDYSRSRR